MRNLITRRSLLGLGLTAFLLLPASGFAQSPQILDPQATRYMALGDSLAAGFKAVPVTDGYVYLLYKDGVFDNITHTLFCNMAVPGATSAEVLAYQVPQAVKPAQLGGFQPDYITLSVGGNDLLKILAFAQTPPFPNHDQLLAFAQTTIQEFGNNLAAILLTLRTELPNTKIFVANQFTLPAVQQFVPETGAVIDSANAVVSGIVHSFPSHVYLVDVHSAFLGRNNLLWADRNGVSPTEVHPTNVGYRVMEKAFADVILANK